MQLNDCARNLFVYSVIDLVVSLAAEPATSEAAPSPQREKVRLHHREEAHMKPSALCATRRLRSVSLIPFAMLACIALAERAAAQVNLALGRPIIDGSGAWQNEPFNGGSFPASRAVDGNINEAEGNPESQWLGREGTLNEYFTLDLGTSIAIDRIDLFNTHNRQFNDRGTDEFVIFGSESVDAGNQLIDPIPVLAGELSDVSGQIDIIPDSFPLPIPVNARYLQFQALTANNDGNNVGLNEIEVFSTGFVSPNKALNKPVINGSGSWDGGVVGVGAAFDGGSFPATAITDGSLIDSGNYWLGREGVPNEYAIIDLEEVVNIQEILLRNTHNAASNDRGTRAFRILASQSVDASSELVSPVEILSSSLFNSSGISPLFENVFTADNGLVPTEARYLKFESLSGTYFNDNVGLNEIEVYDDVMHAATQPPRDDNLALNKPIIDGSSSWNQQAFDGGDFPAAYVTDGSIADGFDGQRSMYWLASEFCPGPDCVDGPDAEAYFTLDLGEVFTIEEINLRNTHNRQFNDRGTEEFVIFGAEEVDESGQLIDPSVIIAGTLPRVDGEAPIPTEVFTEVDGLIVSDARYLKFQALTFYSTIDTAANGGAGLNEIEVYGRSTIGPVVDVDFDDNGSVDTADIDALVAEIAAGTNDADFDLTGDMLVNDSDLALWLADGATANGFAGPYLSGDADLDGSVNSADLNRLGISWQSATAAWSRGDFSADGFVDAGDLNLLAIRWQQSTPLAAEGNAVPEPGALSMVILVILLACGAKRRRG